MKRLRLTLWLMAMDTVALFGGFGSRLYLLCVRGASANTEWE